MVSRDELIKLYDKYKMEAEEADVRGDDELYHYNEGVVDALAHVLRTMGVNYNGFNQLV